MWLKKVLKLLLLGVPVLSFAATGAEYILEDTGISMTQQELAFIVSNWTPQMQQAAAHDAGDRLELLNRALANKKIAAEAEKITPEQDPERYWRQQLLLRNVLREFVVNSHMEELQVPDMTDLAREVFVTQKDKYASIPESRYTSHILFQCRAGKCDRESKRPIVKAVFAKLNTGGNFAELATEYSDDPGTRAKGGAYDHWITKGDAGVEPYYVQATFEIAEVGGMIMADTRFGIHIIRLDKLKPQRYLPFDEAGIIATLENEYKKLAAKEFDAKFRITDDAYIDGPAMDDIFSKYKTAE